ncbi:MAG: DUF2061 domain-containing protein [Bacteroidetes bacterium]|nr:MAG: DUF2061 domain-containing protein [Bacteroidota bacterium]
MKDKSHKRHVTKTITWRIVGTLDTVLLSWIITGNPFIGLKIGIVEIVSKMILYYFHERIWFKSKIKNSNQRHLLKTVTWRILGTLDTIIIAWVITGNGLIGLKIGLAEVITKMVLYYLHEKVWYKIDFGLEKRKN